VTVNRDECLGIDDELDELVAAGNAPKFSMVTTHNSAVCELLSIGIQI